MEPEYEIITKEIPAKGKGYLRLQKCWPDRVGETLHRGAVRLLKQGATHIYVASQDPSAPLAEGPGDGYRLEFRHDMLRMECAITAQGPRPAGRLGLEPLSREKGGQFLAIYNESFFDVPNSATFDRNDLEEILTDRYRCGLALLEDVPVGIYEFELGAESPEIHSIGLMKDQRGQGLGRALLLSVLEEVAALGYDRVSLRVSTANQSAYPLYRSVGFVQTQLLTRWYELIAEGDLCE